MRTLIALLALLAIVVVGCQPVDIQTDEPAFTPIEENVFEQIDEQTQSEQDQNTEESVEIETEEPEQIQETSSNIPTRTVKEGEVVQLSRNFAQDPDGDSLEYIFPEPFDSNGLWRTEIGDAGEYILPIKVTDGDFTSEVTFRVVVESVNTAPSIDIASRIEVFEGETIRLEPDITDREGDDFSVTYSGFMSSPTYVTNFEDAGTYSVFITATDGVIEETTEVIIVIRDQNRPPRIELVSDVQTRPGEVVVVNPVSSDLDGDIVSYSYSDLFDENGQYVPQDGDEGFYNVTLFASDGKTTSQTSFNVQVLGRNRAPTIEAPATVTVLEGETLELDVQAADPDGTDVVITYAGYTTSRTKFIDFDQQGTYEVTVSATDGELTTVQIIQVIVEDVNRAPEFTGDIFA